MTCLDLMEMHLGPDSTHRATVQLTPGYANPLNPSTTRLVNGLRVEKSNTNHNPEACYPHA